MLAVTPAMLLPGVKWFGGLSIGRLFACFIVGSSGVGNGAIIRKMYSDNLRKIHPAERLTRSAGMLNSPFYLLFPLFTATGFQLVSSSPFAYWVGLCHGFLWYMTLTIYYGPKEEMGDVRSYTKPNYGIRLSFLNGLRVGIENGLIIGFLAGLPLGLVYGVFSGMTVGLAFGLYYGVCVGLTYGGRACLQHVCLRWLLRCLKKIPRNYPRFLDYATDRLLLRKVGGGYVFLHRALLEYFASLDVVPATDTGDPLQQMPTSQDGKK